MINIIIPVYKAHDTIQATLHSIAMQRYAEFNTNLVVDGEEPGSYDYLKSFFDINIHYLPVNSGPAVARQYGIDHTDGEFVTFVDADDTLLTSMSLYYMQRNFTDNVVIVSNNFLEEKKDRNLHLRENDMVWMHGKMYRRSFLDKYNIRFNDSRANEDVGFNTQCQCYANEHEQIYLCKDLAYLWQWRDNSTVRTDNAAFTYDQSIEGYVKNKVYAFNNVAAMKGIDDSVKFFIMSGLTHIFIKYLKAMIRAPKQVKHVHKWAKVYYKKLYKFVDDEYSDKAQQAVLNHAGLTLKEQHDEFQVWKEKLNDSR